jgi:sigma-B regulation protein RsbQ
MIFAHGFGCDQNMWRFVAPAFEGDFRTVLFDHVGAGGLDLTAYEPAKYSNLSGYVDDLVEIARELRLKHAVFVGHSVSAMIGVLASLKAPDLFKSLVLVGPSPRYIDDEGYVGGFSAEQIAELLDFLRTTIWVGPRLCYRRSRHGPRVNRGSRREAATPPAASAGGLQAADHR